MEHERSDYQIIWTCEACGHANTDWFNWTAWPTCSDCLEGYDWSDILDDQELSELSEMLNPYDRMDLNGNDW